jgi:hypothetical protein
MRGMKDWLSLGSAAEYLDVSTDTILRRAVPWPKDNDDPIPGRIRYKKLMLGEKTRMERRYYKPDLEAFLVPA